MVQGHLPECLRAVLCCFRLCLGGFGLFLLYNKTRAFGWRNTDKNLLWLNKQKSAILCPSKYSANDSFLPLSKGYLKTHFEFNFKININFFYSNSPSYMPSLPYWPGDPSIYQLLPTLLLSCKISSISSNSPQPLTSICF